MNKHITTRALLWAVLVVVPICFAANTLVDLTSQVTGKLPAANGGTGNAYFAVSGPATSIKTYTFANLTSTIPSEICSGTIALNGLTVASGGKYGASSSAPLQTACSGAAQATDHIIPNLYGDHSAITGFAPSTSGGLTIYIWLDSGGGEIDLYLLNDTSASITTGANAKVSYLVLR